jgi:nucleotidyltransferase/DNA polymerase involved in DNA repair
MQYDPDKSHLSAELKAKFLQNCNSSSPTKAIPGVGPVTADLLSEKGVHSVGDLLEATDSFADMKALVGKVNAHRIYDALEPMRGKAIAATATATAATATAADCSERLIADLKQLDLVEEADDEKMNEEISSCRLS